MKKTLKVFCMLPASMLACMALFGCSGGGQKINDPVKWEEAIKNTLQATEAYKINNVGDEGNFIDHDEKYYYELNSENKPALNNDRNVTITVTDNRKTDIKDAQSDSSATTKYYFKGDKAKLGADYYGMVNGAYYALRFNNILYDNVIDDTYYYYSKRSIHVGNGEYNEFDMGTQDYELTIGKHGYIIADPFQKYIISLTEFLEVLEYKWDSGSDGKLNKQLSFVKPEHFYFDYKNGKYVYNIEKARELEKYTAREVTYKYNVDNYNNWLTSKEKSWAEDDAFYIKREKTITFKDGKIKEIHIFEKLKSHQEYDYKISYEYGKTKDIILPPEDKIIDLDKKPAGV